MGYIYDEIEKHDADGIDFVPIWLGKGLPPVIISYTKEELKTAEKRGYPKSAWKLWRIINGAKVYIT